MNFNKEKKISEKIISTIKDFFKREKIKEKDYKITSNTKVNSLLNEETAVIIIDTLKKTTLTSEVKLFEMIEKNLDEGEEYKINIILQKQKINFYFEFSKSKDRKFKQNKIEYRKTEKKFIEFLNKIEKYKYISKSDHTRILFINGYALLGKSNLFSNFKSGILKYLEYKYNDTLFEYSKDGYEIYEHDDLTYKSGNDENVKIKCQDIKLIRALVSGIDEIYSPLVNAAWKILEHKNK